MMCTMSGPADENGKSNGLHSSPQDAAGVLANLPRSRPQRSSARRDAARRTRAKADSAAVTSEASGAAARTPRAKASSAARAKAAGERRAKPRPDRPGTKRAAPSRAKAREEVPTQGFESVAERASGSVQPPGSTELIASAAEMLGDVAKAGLATGERLLKDVFSLLPRS
jgi:hypothetical protein